MNGSKDWLSMGIWMGWVFLNDFINQRAAYATALAIQKKGGKDMSNWCVNTLSVRGSNQDLNEFARYVSSDERVLDFEEIVPEPAWKCSPDGACNQKWDFGHGLILDWHDWRCGVWGTKWNLEEGNIGFERRDDEIIYRFQTAWSPPTGIIRRLVRLFPNLVLLLEYEEPMKRFFGFCCGVEGHYSGIDCEMTAKSHPEYIEFPCDECDEDYLHDGSVCPYCGYDEVTGDVKAAALE